LSIGYKIKMLRGQRGMTQSDLASGIISRAMLSRIENDDATPSVTTLIAIAEKLQVPASFLLEDNDDLLPAERERLIRQITAEYTAGDMDACLNLFRLTAFSDPAYNTIRVTAAFSVALHAFLTGDFPKARAALDEGESILPTLLLPVSEVSPARIAFLRSVMDNIGDLEIVCNETNQPDFSFSPALFFYHMHLLTNGKTDISKMLLELCPLTAPYDDFIFAQYLIREYKFVDAILQMKALSVNQDCPFFVRLLAYRSMEDCCKLCEDYKGAYEYHLKRQELLLSCEKSS